jgi:hypothetical protein
VGYGNVELIGQPTLRQLGHRRGIGLAPGHAASICRLDSSMLLGGDRCQRDRGAL